MAKSKPIKVGISGINAVDNPGPGVGVARSLKEDKGLNVQVHGLAYDAMDPGIYLDWVVDKSFIVPYPSSNHEGFIERLLYIKENHGLDFIFPMLDAELPLYIKYHGELKSRGITTFLPTMEQFKLRSKENLDAVAEAIGIVTPRSKVVSSFTELTAAIAELGLPVMVKGAFYKAYIAYTPQEAMANYNKIVAEWGYPIILQKVVTGEEMNVVAAGDGEGNSLGMVGLRKILITSLGKIWTGVSIRHDGMLRAAAKFIEEYKWKGGFELECIVTEDAVNLIEINPRFPAWTYFATGVGTNLPANCLRKAMGLPLLKNSEYETGKLYIRYTYELVTDMKGFQDMITKGERT
jgi:carbamoyl-phosphate synthase large subunit